MASGTGNADAAPLTSKAKMETPLRRDYREMLARHGLQHGDKIRFRLERTTGARRFNKSVNLEVYDPAMVEESQLEDLVELEKVELRLRNPILSISYCTQPENAGEWSAVTDAVPSQPPSPSRHETSALPSNPNPDPAPAPEDEGSDDNDDFADALTDFAGFWALAGDGVESAEPAPDAAPDLAVTNAQLEDRNRFLDFRVAELGARVSEVELALATSLNECAAEARTELDAVRTERDAALARVGVLEQAVADVQGQLDIRDAELAQAATDRAQATADLEQEALRRRNAEQELAVVKASNEGLAAELQAREKELGDLQLSHDALSRHVLELGGQKDAVRLERDDLQRRNSELDAGNRGLERRNSELEAGKCDLEQRLSKLEQDLREQASGFDRQREEWAAEKAAADRTIASLEGTIRDADAALTDEKQQFQRHKTTFANELTRKEHELSKVRSEAEKLREESEGSERAFKAAKKDLAAREAAFAEERELARQTAADSSTAAAAATTALESTVRTLNERVAELEGQLRDSAASLAAQKQQHLTETQSLLEEKERQAESLAEANRTQGLLEEKERQLEDKERQAEGLAEANRIAVETLEATKRKLETARTDLGRLKDELDVAWREIEELRTLWKLEQERSASEDLRQRLAELERQRGESQEACRGMQATIDELRKLVDAAEAKQRSSDHVPGLAVADEGLAAPRSASSGSGGGARRNQVSLPVTRILDIPFLGGTADGDMHATASDPEDENSFYIAARSVGNDHRLELPAEAIRLPKRSPSMDRNAEDDLLGPHSADERPRKKRPASEPVLPALRREDDSSSDQRRYNAPELVCGDIVHSYGGVQNLPPGIKQRLGGDDFQGREVQALANEYDPVMARTGMKIAGAKAVDFLLLARQRLRSMYPTESGEPYVSDSAATKRGRPPKVPQNIWERMGLVPKRGRLPKERTESHGAGDRRGGSPNGVRSRTPANSPPDDDIEGQSADWDRSTDMDGDYVPRGHGPKSGAVAGGKRPRAPAEAKGGNETEEEVIDWDGLGAPAGREGGNGKAKRSRVGDDQGDGRIGEDGAGSAGRAGRAIGADVGAPQVAPAPALPVTDHGADEGAGPPPPGPLGPVVYHEEEEGVEDD
ncbi:hypothetical protein DFJ74DRAFT_708040 [Hyaloraphidium curvatum]|nr:hypothetical protein DFJ74DRAFT_708040 [Hyaloraphidium curvatum]